MIVDETKRNEGRMKYWQHITLDFDVFVTDALSVILITYHNYLILPETSQCQSRWTNRYE